MGMRNTFDRKKVSEAPPIDKTLGTAFDTVKSLADKLPIIEYLEKNVDGLVVDIKASEATAVAASQQAVTSAAGAKGSADAAKLSQDAAHASELAAAQSASDLAAAVAHADADVVTTTQKAQAASDSAAAALTSEQNAKSSEQAAKASEDAAKLSEDNAKLSETNAKTSEQASAQNLADTVTAKNAAAQSEANAKASEDSAELSETNAIDAEQAAFASQTAAATSESNAKTAEQGAATSLAQAQAIVKTLNQLYLGAKSADPTTDNNGDALIVGAEYFNTTTNQLRVYTSTGWQDQDATAETMAANATASASAAAGSAQAALDSQNAAKTSEDNAKTSETNSKTNADNSLTRAGAALDSANAAAGSAQAAADSQAAAHTSEQNSATSASLAQAWAVQDTTMVNGVDYSAKYWANQAKISAQSITYPIPASNGGIGRTTLTANSVLVGDGTNPVKMIGPGTNGQMLLGATGASPYWGTNPAISGATIDNTPIGNTTPSYGTFNGATIRNASPNLVLDDVNGGWPEIIFKKSGVQRWALYGDVSNNPAFYLIRYNSDGSYASTPFSIDWATQVLTLQARPVWAGATPWDSANLVSPWTASNLANPMTLDTAQTVTGAKTFSSVTVTGGSTSLGSTAASSVVEVGGAATTQSAIDFHSIGGAGNDYDARLIAPTGTGVAGTAGRGQLNFVGASFWMADQGNNYSAYLRFQAGSFSPFMRGDNTGTIQFIDSANANVNFSITNAGVVTARGNVAGFSDEKLKKNWKPLQPGIISKIAALTKSGTFERTDMEGRYAGVGAQSWQKIIPEAVKDLNGTLTVDYAGSALAVIVELCREIENLQSRLTQLESV